MNIQYIADKDVTPVIDAQLRYILSTCFAEDAAIFSQQRFFNEMPPHRYFVLDNSENIVAHIAVHEKNVIIDDVELPVAGIAEVCVLPRYRKQGLVHNMLDHIHKQLEKKGIHFSILFGDYCIYNSNGYQDVTNLIIFLDGQWKPVKAMACGITSHWPKEPVKLEGAPF
ncbi:GNAT family N-acetyltransferase [Vibrio sp. VB16]|uniref:GNAT family N-acetyltransferase n=1 Tax=Vibrio sp. VB16 TaxID=2785746 RepID=UPI00189CC7ED|nr:GNAT family N-acetyltransferase [Vibrio sp. VB16]UGA55966.1 GNAT family N-acetyltransferase [Vibrio sp. VB16]